MRSVETKAETARLGVIVPKKGNRLAARRNRIKRIIRNEFRLTRHCLVSADIIVHVTGPIEDADLRASLRQGLQHLVVEQDP